jgi:hypothetical protein
MAWDLCEASTQAETPATLIQDSQNLTQRKQIMDIKLASRLCIDFHVLLRRDKNECRVSISLGAAAGSVETE